MMCGCASFEFLVRRRGGRGGDRDAVFRPCLLLRVLLHLWPFPFLSYFCRLPLLFFLFLFLLLFSVQGSDIYITDGRIVLRKNGKEENKKATTRFRRLTRCYTPHTNCRERTVY
jgi:hypothetical protein